MKIAILADARPSYVRPLSEGLARMFARLGVDHDLVYKGLDSLPGANRIHEGMTPGQKARTLGKRLLRFRWYDRLVRRLEGASAAVVVNHMPVAYQQWLFDDARLRADLPGLPIGLYDLAYLPTRGPWARRLLENDPDFNIPPGRHRGLDRYDFHLCVTEVSENPVPEGCDGYFRVGLDLQCDDLFVEPQPELRALVDFERTDHVAERRVQLNALRRAGIPYTVLKGRYPMSEIRRIYRSCGLYFIAHRESFGLPICEVQACGGLVFTPYSEWCPSHAFRGGTEDRQLPANFVVYGNDEDRLVAALAEAKETFDPIRNRARFAAEQPQFLQGDAGALLRFVEELSARRISSSSHKLGASLMDLTHRISQASPAGGREWE